MMGGKIQHFNAQVTCTPLGPDDHNIPVRDRRGRTANQSDRSVGTGRGSQTPGGDSSSEWTDCQVSYERQRRWRIVSSKSYQVRPTCTVVDASQVKDWAVMKSSRVT